MTSYICTFGVCTRMQGKGPPSELRPRTGADWRSRFWPLEGEKRVVHAAGFAEHCCIGLLPKKVGRKARHTAFIILHFVIHLSFICHSFDIHLSFLCQSIDTHLVIYLSCLCNVGSPSTIQKFPKLWQESLYRSHI